MQPAGPGRDYHALVQQTYDLIAADYNRGRLNEPDDARALAPLIDRLPHGSRVLDLGCGAGVPITLALSQRYDVTGVDFSTEQIALAKVQVPDATFLQADMTTCAFPEGSFDAVVSFFAIFHVPREEHAALFERVGGWLKPGGYFLATLALDNEAAYTEGDYFGQEMHWSNFGIEEYERLLVEIGFEVLDSWLLEDDPTTTENPERHPIVLARRT
jgi:cyclopropane fatty-acyl-phospholipid synthase-like methyltransferase